MSDLGPSHKNAWIGFFVAHAMLVRKINAAMEEAGVVPLDVYGALLGLEEADGNRLRMSELAEHTMLTRSGITRLADRLERDGLVERQNCPRDRRSCHAVLTPKGRAERERAWPIYRAAIATHFAPHMTQEEAQVISRVFLGMLPSGLPGVESE